MYSKSLICSFPMLFGLISVQAATADDHCNESSGDCVAVGKWNFSLSLGAGVRTDPLGGSKNIPLVVIPQFSYYGKRLFIDNLDLGFSLAENDTNTLALIASPGYDRVFFYRSDLQNIFINGLPPGGQNANNNPPPPPVMSGPRRVTYLAGPEWTFKQDGLSGQLDVLHDITGRDHGTEVRAALGIPLVKSRQSLTASVGVTWKSAGIVNYYYGEHTVYQAGSALDPFVKLGYTVPLSSRWRFSAFAQYERLGDAIADSPIVSEHYVATAFVGAIYTL
jgi:outer membrane protein